MRENGEQHVLGQRRERERHDGRRERYMRWSAGQGARKAGPRVRLSLLPPTMSSTTRLRHRGVQEEEDAASLRLGAGACMRIHSCASSRSSGGRVQHSRLPRHLRG
jgi:streptomycin 6-kinase